MRILTVTTLYPNAEMPSLGIFIETRMKQFTQHYPDTHLEVLAPVPWFPFTSSRFKTYAKYAAVPKKELRNGTIVHHPRYVVLPKIGMLLTPFFMALTLLLFFVRNKINRRYDLVDGHYYFPDGVAISLICKIFNLPFALTARGTDINLIPRSPIAKRMVRFALKNADRNLAVCDALGFEMKQIYPEGDSVITARNGVDLDLFRFSDDARQQVLRRKLKLDLQRPVAVVVGWLIERKGQHLIIDALKHSKELTVYFIGSGPEHKNLQQQAERLGVSGRCVFVGSKPQSDLSDWFGAADISILASNREGWANVLLESMACGTPVVATDIWGTPEIVSSANAGVLVERSVTSIASGIQKLLDAPPRRSDVRGHAEQFSWDDTTQLLHQTFSDVILQSTATQGVNQQ